MSSSDIWLYRVINQPGKSNNLRFLLMWPQQQHNNNSNKIYRSTQINVPKPVTQLLERRCRLIRKQTGGYYLILRAQRTREADKSQEKKNISNES